VLLTGCGATAQVAQTRLRPLDPLTEQERATAIALATGDARVRRLIGGRESDVGYAELLVEKGAGSEGDTPERPAMSGRFAEVLIAAFEREFQGIRVLVNLEDRTVRDVATSVPGQAGAREARGFTVPFTRRERAIAREEAQRNPEIRAAVGAALQGYEPEGLPITRVIPGICPSGRCMEMIFRRGDTYLTSSIIVDIPSRSSRFRRGPQ
jgi:hypothetical protein